VSAPFVVLVTFPSMEVARRVSTALVTEGFAACVNLLPGAESVYRWEGNIEVAPEIVGLVKTTGSQVEDLERLYLQLHPYEVPEFLIIGTAGGNAAYLDWITRSCSVTEPPLSVKRNESE
jgi:periplasmic divalent cation tolerance protein